MSDVIGWRATRWTTTVLGLPRVSATSTTAYVPSKFCAVRLRRGYSGCVACVQYFFLFLFYMWVGCIYAALISLRPFLMTMGKRRDASVSAAMPWHFPLEFLADVGVVVRVVIGPHHSKRRPLEHCVQLCHFRFSWRRDQHPVRVACVPGPVSTGPWWRLVLVAWLRCMRHATCSCIDCSLPRPAFRQRSSFTTTAARRPACASCTGRCGSTSTTWGARATGRLCSARASTGFRGRFHRGASLRGTASPSPPSATPWCTPIRATLCSRGVVVVDARCGNQRVGMDALDWICQPEQVLFSCQARNQQHSRPSVYTACQGKAMTTRASPRCNSPPYATSNRFCSASYSSAPRFTKAR